MQMRPRRYSGRLRMASLACSATASACWRALKPHGVSVKRARLGLTRCEREVESRGVGCMPVYSHAALGLAALSAGDLSDAAAKLQRAWDLSFRQGMNNPNVVPMAGDLAEALARVEEKRPLYTDSQLAGRASPGNRIGIPPRRRLPGAGNLGNRARGGAALVCCVPRRTGQSRPYPIRTSTNAAVFRGGDAPQPPCRRRAGAA